MTKMLKKVFNWSEFHLSEMTCYKIHTLGMWNKFYPILTPNNIRVNKNGTF